jgi:hypothetical protein
MNGNIRNFNELSIYAFKGGFKRPNAKFDNGRARFMHLREALKGIMTDLVSILFYFYFFVHIWYFKIKINN